MGLWLFCLGLLWVALGFFGGLSFFCLFVVAVNLLYTTTTNGLCGCVCFGVCVGSWLLVGCGGFCRQLALGFGMVVLAFVALRHLPSPYLKGELFFSLYVGVAVLEFPQDGLRLRLRFGDATFSSVCFGVGYGFSFTRDTCFYVETAAVWM